MSWLVSDARVLASVETADTRAQRRRGLLGRDEIDGAFVIDPCRWVHTIGMHFPIDVAFVDAEQYVTKIARMRPHRVGMPVRGARYVIEAGAGSFERWGLGVGDRVEVRLDDASITP